MDQAVQRFFSAGLMASTHKTYEAAERRYLNFCKSFSIRPLPTSEEILCYFVACLGQQGLAHTSIRTYLSGVRQLQIAHGFKNPEIDQMPRLRQILKGVKVERGKEGKAPRPRLPITPSILRKLKAVWLNSNTSFNPMMLWAAALVTFFSFCRSGEITVEDERKYDPKTHLSFADVSVDNAVSPSVISLNIKYSKTDQGRVGVRVILGRTGDDLCPVLALLNYLSRRGSKPGVLFQCEDGIPLSKTKFVDATRQALTAAQLPAKDYAGHSFRIGAATTAAMAGLEDSAIQTLGRWKSSSYQLYIRMNPQQLAAMSSSLSRCSI